MRYYWRAAVASFFLAPAVTAGQTSVESIYIIPGSHLDVGFTDTPSGVRQKRIAILDEAVDAAESDPGFYWLEESAWVFDAWHERNRGNDARLALARRLFQTDRLGAGATWVNPLVGAIPEGLPVLTLHLDEMERDFDYRPSVAVLNDPPSYPETLVDELAARGVRYLLIGANMFISRPLPSRLTRSPFYWESSGGARILTYIDPESYIAGIALGPRCAKAFDPERFPADVDDMETMRRAIGDLLQTTDSRYDALMVQHAFDNWDTECARYLSDAVRRWNDAGRRPHLELAPPERYFRHIEERYGPNLPVYRGEWGGHWDAQHWAIRPVTFWRVREAARALQPDASREAKAAIATALDHNVGGSGCSIWGFTETQVRESAAEISELLEAAIRLSQGPDALEALPPAMSRPRSGPLPEPWLEVLTTDAVPARVRAGTNFVGPFVRGNTGEWAIPLDFGANDERLVIHARVDRRIIPGSKERLTYVVIEIPLRANRRSLRLAPEGVPNALMNDWLLGGPPNGIVTGPDGVRVIGLEREITVSSPIVVSWTLHAPDPDEPELTWLQGLVVAQSELCELRGGDRVVFPYDVLYQGEPAIVDVDVQLELR